MPSETEATRLRAVYREYMPRVASRWAPGNPGNRAILTELERGVTELLAGRRLVPFAARTALDVGCGYGHFLGLLRRLGAAPENLHGVDLVEERVEYARGAHPGVDIRVGNAEALPFADGSFDVVLLFSVLTSILDPEVRTSVGREAARVLRPDGAILWYDFRFDHPSNPNVRGVGRREIADVFPGFEARLRTTTLLPPLARALGPLTTTAYPLLAAVPLLRSHHLGLIVRRGR